MKTVKRTKAEMEAFLKEVAADTNDTKISDKISEFLGLPIKFSCIRMTVDIIDDIEAPDLDTLVDPDNWTVSVKYKGKVIDVDSIDINDWEEN